MSFTLRTATAADASAVAALITAHDARHHQTGDRFSEDDVRDWWKRVEEVVVAVDDSGLLVGTGSLRRRGPNYLSDNFTHPDFTGLGIGSALLDWAEERTLAAGLRALRAGAAARDAPAKELLESRGFRYIRSFYRMTIDLDELPPAPVWPDGFTVAFLRPGEEGLLHETLEEAFTDHWGFEPRPFEQWIADNGPLDGRLCYLVRTEGGETAAAQICDEERWGTALVAILGVRPAWRKRGLGEALLRRAFYDLYARGQPRIALGVDAENPTGATRLYERVGMQVSSQDDAYEKLLQRD